MAPSSKPERVRNADLDPNIASTASAEAALKARLNRKRTKTGCLTCRKRRIKCGEERPVCRNCVKSKRGCEGYSQRVVFKQPTFDYRPVAHGGAHITFQANPFPGQTDAYEHEYVQPVFDPSFHPHLQPRPIEQYGPTYQHAEQQSVAPEAYAPNCAAIAQPPPGVVLYYPQQAMTANFDQQPNSFGPPMVQHTVPYQRTAMSDAMNLPSHVVPVDYTPLLAQPSSDGHDFNPGHAGWQREHRPIKQESHEPYAAPTISTKFETVSPTSSESSRTLGRSSSSAVPNSNGWTPGPYQPRPELSRPIDYQAPPVVSHNAQQKTPSLTSLPVHEINQDTAPDYYDYEVHPHVMNHSSHFLTRAAVETQDDNYYDVDSDEEIELDTRALAERNNGRKRQLQSILQHSNMNLEDLQMHRHDAYMYNGILDHYRVEDAANPLRNAATASVFAHFIYVTGPGLSMFERHGKNASVLLEEGHVPFLQQGLWTYAMPVAALRNQALLHAMLAMSSLHISKIQRASETPSRQHYMWACKRVNRLLTDPKKRYKTTTIATSMLLGFYEVMAADHRQWNVHLTGSKQLFAETDFSNMTRQFRQMKRARAARLHFGKQNTSTSPIYDAQDEILDQIDDVDERTISRFVGKTVRYDDHGWITPQSGVPAQLNLSNFGMLKDLYWWYLKQDVFQSIISGNPLLLEYSRWANCPPRAPLGRPDAVYGSYDHLVLIFGRVADFAAKDRKRKLKQMEANGGQWRPAPGMKMPGPPPPRQQAGPPTPVSATNGQLGFPQTQGPPQAAPPPPFYGMAPAPTQKPQMPSAYSSRTKVPSPPSPEESMDLPSWTRAALEEYGGIRAALHEFSQSLGEAFKPLSAEYQPPIDTPFGRALLFRSHHIGVLWAMYHMAVIVAIRSGPNMHPAAHAAAAISSQETAFHANEIGRITAAITPPPPGHPLNPTLTAALCDSCMPSFFAAIQYIDAHQRYATVTRIFDIAMRSGWGSIEIMANGCETAWIKAAALGRGPPYTRVVRPEDSEDPRLNGRWEELDLTSPPDETDPTDRRLVGKQAQARLTWAVGVMGVEDDIGMDPDDW